MVGTILPSMVGSNQMVGSPLVYCYLQLSITRVTTNFGNNSIYKTWKCTVLNEQ